VGERRDFKFYVRIDHNKSRLADEKRWWKGRRHVTWPWNGLC